MKRFSQKSVIITGGSSGIGLAAAERFLKEGAQVSICSRSPERVQQAVDLLSHYGEVKGYAADLSKEAEVQSLIDNVISTFGKLDILVNSAGLAQSGKITELSLIDYQTIVDANLTHTFLMCQRAIEHLKKTRGRIVNVSSLAGRFRSSFSGAHYTASKAAIIGLTRHLALEFGEHGVHVNVVCPGPTKTEMLASALDKFGEETIKNQNPLKRLMQPEDVAGPILFLSSQDAIGITGASLDVNCGIF